ncbi:TetR/AcrR family transcriptional regulator C-terminal domain-containing protein [Streptomyces sp. NPDC004610]|uniref:TetR/AcrR family transcriptional regulator C-terminal domain-containing protein n=1 Tax=unclassified Streptomyces TaxID=2593676 RepID=UPI0033B0F518
MSPRRAGTALSREKVVMAAIDVLDETGYDGLTMRLVAKHLGVQLNTVYWHASSKPELLELMADELLAPAVTGPLPEPWEERLRVLLGRYRDALLGHRDGARVVAGTYPVLPNTLRLAETLLATLIDAGLSERTASWATWHASHLVIGSAQEEQAAPAAIGDRLRQGVDAERYPLLDRIVGVHTDSAYGERFAFDVELFLTGLRGMRERDGREGEER